METQAPVVVGVDGSEQSLAAATWAADDAALRRAPLRPVLVTDLPPYGGEPEKVLHSAVLRATGHHPDLATESEVRRGNPARELVAESGGAQLLVVGSRGRSPVRARLLGSVSTKVATHAHCPTVVVRDHPADSGPVVVGLDNSPHSRAALRFAFGEAAARGSELVAVQVWEEDEYAPVVPLLDIEVAERTDETRRALSEQLAGWSQDYPTVAVREIARRGNPVVALTTLGKDAQLVVVGHRGRGGFAGMLLGSVATGVLDHAPCPVAVVRDRTK
ncbi:universal stress protein [Saccharopolyspora erythraea]|uniref:universal stress protein n=1 Tax=Saccharopolyspora erythraea TaxID=1836 RepID=UPI001BA5146D|nr:universal stress protein [Saccharopolyspora erythraea]QUH02148.1 universal stress protein [Saccharopolyspora erythraea]